GDVEGQRADGVADEVVVDAALAHEPLGGTEPDEVGERGDVGDRAARLGPEGDLPEARGDGGAGPAAGPVDVALRVVGVERAAADGAEGVPVGGELRHVRLPE